jgi:hypothetical protein
MRFEIDLMKYWLCEKNCAFSLTISFFDVLISLILKSLSKFCHKTMKFIHAETNVFAITRIKVCNEPKCKNKGKI